MHLNHFTPVTSNFIYWVFLIYWFKLSNLQVGRSACCLASIKFSQKQACCTWTAGESSKLKNTAVRVWDDGHKKLWNVGKYDSWPENSHTFTSPTLEMSIYKNVGFRNVWGCFSVWGMYVLNMYTFSRVVVGCCLKSQRVLSRSDVHLYLGVDWWRWSCYNRI